MTLLPTARQARYLILYNDSFSGLKRNSKVPYGVAVMLSGGRVYVTNHLDNMVSVIDAANDTATAAWIPVGVSPAAFGAFIQPPAKTVFAGKPGKKTCVARSIAALVRQHGRLKVAASARGYAGMPVLKVAIRRYCCNS